MYAVIQLVANRHRVTWRGDAVSDLAACAAAAQCDVGRLRRTSAVDPEFRVYELSPVHYDSSGDEHADAQKIMRTEKCR